MSDERVDIILAESPAIFIEDADDDIGVDVIIDNHIEVDVAEAIPIDHGQMPGLGDDDHPQYHNDARGDARYEPKLGNPLVDDYVLSSKTTGVRSWVPAATIGGSGVTDHGLLTGLGDDDHTQYHNAARADTWLAGKTFDHGALSGKDDDDHPHYLTQGRGDARYSQLLHKHAGEDITSGTIDGNRLPAISTTKKGAVPPTSDPPTGKVLSDGNSWVAIGDLYNPFQTLTDDEYVDWNLVNGKNARVTLGGNRTLRLTTPGNGMSGFLLVRQDGTGSRTLTLPAGSLMMEGGSLTLDTAPNARTFLYFEYDGTNYFWHRVREYALPDHNHDAYYVSVVGSPNLTNFPMLNPSGELINGSYGPSDFAAASHNHAATAITSGTLDGDRLPAMSTTKKGAVPATGTPSGKFLNDGGSWVGPSSFYATFQTLEDAASVKWNLLNGYNAKVTLEGNRALSITNASSGMSGLLIVKQDATGNRTLTLPSGSIILGGGTLTLSTAANAVDILTFVYDGTNYYWSLGKGYA